MSLIKRYGYQSGSMQNSSCLKTMHFLPFLGALVQFGNLKEKNIIEERFAGFKWFLTAATMYLPRKTTPRLAWSCGPTRDMKTPGDRPWRKKETTGQKTIESTARVGGDLYIGAPTATFHFSSVLSNVSIQWLLLRSVFFTKNLKFDWLNLCFRTNSINPISDFYSNKYTSRQ